VQVWPQQFSEHKREKVQMAVPAEKIVVEPTSGRMVSFLGNQMVIKIQGDQTSGALSIIEGLYPPGNFTPPHRHVKTDEVGYILEGELGVMVAEEDFQAGAGTFFLRPKGVPHALWNITDRPVRYLDMYTPAGLEAWFEELARLTTASTPPTLEQLFEAGRRYDTIYMPELAPPLMKKYGLKLEIPGGKS
jgi:quercetin dioxygenase-like cupin family protein